MEHLQQRRHGKMYSLFSLEQLQVVEIEVLLRCFITVYGNLGMITCLFDAIYGSSYLSLTQIACSGNGAQSLLNSSNVSTGGTQQVFLQLNVSTAQTIQVKVASACTVSWYVTYL